MRNACWRAPGRACIAVRSVSGSDSAWARSGLASIMARVVGLACREVDSKGAEAAHVGTNRVGRTSARGTQSTHNCGCGGRYGPSSESA